MAASALSSPAIAATRPTHFAICSISACLNPRLVAAQVPSRIPLGSNGFRVSNGTELQLHSIPAFSSAWAIGAALGGNTIRDQARAALKLDLSERFKSVKQKLSTDLAFGNGQGCVKAEADRIEISAVHVHAAYLRVYVGVTGRASVYVPCPG